MKLKIATQVLLLETWAFKIKYTRMRPVSTDRVYIFAIQLQFYNTVKIRKERSRRSLGYSDRDATPQDYFVSNRSGDVLVSVLF